MGRRRKITMKDVAERAGVSVMTVSATLGGNYPTVYVSDATRARVREVAREMDYRPNAIARSLRQQVTNVIGAYLSIHDGHRFLNPADPFYAVLLGGLHTACAAHKKDILLHAFYPDRQVEDIYTEIVDGRIDGLIVFARPGDPLVDKLVETELPVVAVGEVIQGIPSVGPDNIAGSRLLVEYLIRKGHHHIIYRSSLLNLTSLKERRAAFLEAAAAHNLEVEEWRAEEFTNPDDIAIASWLDRARPHMPTAAVCWNDQAAYDLLRICHRRGVRVPDDLAICGFDGLVIPNRMPERLTTIDAHWSQVAQASVDLLTARMKGETVVSATVLPVSLIIGDTA